MSNQISEIKNRHAQVNQQIKATTANVAQIYEDVRLRLNQKLQSFVLKHKADDYQGKALVACIEGLQKEYAEFEEKFREEMKRAIPYVAEGYYFDALTDMGEVLGKFDTKRVEAVLQDTYTHIAGMTQYMTGTTVQNLRNVVARTLRESAMSGMTQKEVSATLLDRLLASDSQFKFVDAKNRVWNSEAYVEMLSRTTLLNTGRETYLDTCAEKGKDVVRITVSGNACPKCAEWENRLVSISGKTKGLPTLQNAIDGGLFHPNCTHSTVAVGDYDRENNFDENGRPKKGYNSADKPNPKGNDPEANREYRKSLTGKAEKTPKVANVKTNMSEKQAAREAVLLQEMNKVDYHWENNMSNEEKQSIWDYTASDVHKLNEVMRFGGITPAQQKQINLLNNTLEKYPKHVGDVYRASTFRTAEARDKFINQLKSGDLKKSFLSTSVNPKVQDKYIYKVSKTFENPKEKYPVCITYADTKSGVYLGPYSSVPSDKEVLFSSDIEFEYLDSYEKDGILYVTMKEKG